MKRATSICLLGGIALSMVFYFAWSACGFEIDPKGGFQAIDVVMQG